MAESDAHAPAVPPRYSTHRKIGFIPVVIVVALLGWALVAYVGVLCPSLWRTSPALALVCGLLFTALFAMVALSYHRVVFTDPGTPNWAPGTMPTAGDDGPPANVSAQLRAEHAEFLAKMDRRTAPAADLERVVVAGEPGLRQRAPPLKFGPLDADSDSERSDDEEACLGGRANAQYVELSSRPSLAKTSGDGPVDLRHELGWTCVEAKLNGEARFCGKCRVAKPDRAHHCSVCGTCRLRMDHHCPWVNNCIGYGNHAYFFAFVLWGALLCGLVIATALPHLISLASAPNADLQQLSLNVIFLAVGGLVFGLAMTTFCGAHLHLILTNETTLESMQGFMVLRIPLDHTGDSEDSVQIVEWRSRARVWDLGWRRNWAQTMGRSTHKWLFPVRSGLFCAEGDGHGFPMNRVVFRRIMRRLGR